jgi:hypothetical protein
MTTLLSTKRSVTIVMFSDFRVPRVLGDASDIKEDVAEFPRSDS